MLPVIWILCSRNNLQKIEKSEAAYKPYFGSVGAKKFLDALDNDTKANFQAKYDFRKSGGMVPWPLFPIRRMAWFSL